jgi:hypothetical protein
MTDTEPTSELTPERLRELRRCVDAAAHRVGATMLAIHSAELGCLLDAAEERVRLRARVAELEEAIDREPYAHLGDPTACSFCGDRSARHVQGPLVRICETCARGAVREFDGKAGG